MKGKFNLVIGLFGIFNVIYYIVKCPAFDCEQAIFGIPLSGPIYVIFWTILSVVILNGVYKENKNKGA